MEIVSTDDEYSEKKGESMMSDSVDVNASSFSVMMLIKPLNSLPTLTSSQIVNWCSSAAGIINFIHPMHCFSYTIENFKIHFCHKYIPCMFGSRLDILRCPQKNMETINLTDKHRNISILIDNNLIAVRNNLILVLILDLLVHTTFVQ